MIEIPLTYQDFDGRLFLFSMARLELQCAYCLYSQPLMPKRNEEGLVTAVVLRPEDEQHAEGCKQK